MSALLLEVAHQVAGHAEEGAPRLRPGAVVDRFEIVRESGCGGFGVVYEAVDRELGRTVALKVVCARGGHDLPAERLLREAEAAARLSHPNIVALYDVGRCEQGPYLVMELLCGQTLARRLEQGRLPVLEALRIGVEVAKGLAHAHSRGVVHRDLTPGNVYLCDDGQVKLLDLGMAHAFGRRKLDGGTPAYMAPEQAQAAPEDERTDVFALGIVLFEMLSGERPFADDRALVSRRRAPALEVAAQPGLGALVARMLETEPVKRPRDAGVVLAALSTFYREVDRGSAPDTPRVRRRAWTMTTLRGERAKRVAVSLALGLLVAAATGAVVAGRGSRAVPRSPGARVVPAADTESVGVATAGRGGLPLAPGGKPYGQPYEEWAVAWWKWAMGVPKPVNPMFDATGEHCAVGQQGHVWFLAGSNSSAERRCAIPAGRPLFFPVLNIVHCGHPDDPPAAVSDLEVTVAPIEQATRLEVLVNGYPVAGLRRYLVTTPVFSVVAPADNVHDVPVGTLLSPCLDKGYYVMLTPLAPGQHTLVIRGTAPLVTVDVTYHLEVGAGR